jgi:hypothetical protein
MSNTIVLRGLPVDLTSATGHQFVVDCTRAGEGLLTDNDLRDKYELSDKNWEKSQKHCAHTCHSSRERTAASSTLLGGAVGCVAARTEAPQSVKSEDSERSGVSRGRDGGIRKKLAAGIKESVP